MKTIRRLNGSVSGGALAVAVGTLLPMAAMANSYDYEGYQVESNIVAGEVSKEGPPWQHRPTIRVPGTRTDFAIGGYLKLDMNYDFDADLGNVTNGPNLTGAANATDGKFSAHARETRINLRTHTPTDWGKLTTFIEADFGGQPGPNQSTTDGTFFLRHAYVSVGSWLFGQTWSNAMGFVASPRIIKLGSPNGSVFERHAQVRYSLPLSQKSLFAVSMESASPQIVNADPSGGASQRANIDVNTPLPDLTARYRYGRSVEVSGVLRQLEVENAGNAAFADDSALGWGVQAQFAYPVLPKMMLKLSVFTGEGISDLITPRLPDAYVRNGQLETVEHTSGFLAIENRWSRQWMSTVSYGVVDRGGFEGPGFDNQVRTQEMLHADLFYDPMPRLSFGIGYTYAKIDDEIAGNVDDAHRISGMVKVHF